jgi:hypothetical protein
MEQGRLGMGCDCESGGHLQATRSGGAGWGGTKQRRAGLGGVGGYKCGKAMGTHRCSDCVCCQGVCVGGGCASSYHC